MNYEDDTPQGDFLTPVGLTLAVCIFGIIAAIAGLAYLAQGASLDAEVVARIEAEASARKSLTPSEYACIRQWAAGAYDHNTKPHCASGTRELPAHAMTKPVAQ